MVKEAAGGISAEEENYSVGVWDTKESGGANYFNEECGPRIWTLIGRYQNVKEKIQSKKWSENSLYLCWLTFLK